MDIRKNLFSERAVRQQEQAAQGSGGVTIPGGVHEKGRCGTEGHGVVGNIGAKCTVDLDDLEVFSNLNDSMILTAA